MGGGGRVIYVVNKVLERERKEESRLFLKKQTVLCRYVLKGTMPDATSVPTFVSSLRKKEDKDSNIYFNII